jgi:soluble lytic murein transglycosylase-like protein
MLSASCATASVQVTFVGGRTLLVDSIKFAGGKATLSLPGGGSMSLEAGRILKAEAVAEPPAPPQSPIEGPGDAPAATPGAPSPAMAAPVPEPQATLPQATVTEIDYPSLIASAAARHRVDAELLKCLLEVESGFDPRAVSPKGAMGVAQLMPETAHDLGVKNPFDPVEAVDAAARLLHDLLERSGGRFVPALAAYNAGQGAVTRYGGLPPYHETYAYIERILTLYGRR